MTKASTALHHILTTHPITATQLTTALQIPTATFTAWLQGHLAPPSDSLNISALARLFNDTTNAYKYLFFLSLLDILRRHPCQPTSPIAFLVVEAPVVQFKDPDKTLLRQAIALAPNQGFLTDWHYNSQAG